MFHFHFFFFEPDLLRPVSETTELESRGSAHLGESAAPGITESGESVPVKETTVDSKSSIRQFSFEYWASPSEVMLRAQSPSPPFLFFLSLLILFPSSELVRIFIAFSMWIARIVCHRVVVRVSISPVSSCCRFVFSFSPPPPHESFFFSVCFPSCFYACPLFLHSILNVP